MQCSCSSSSHFSGGMSIYQTSFLKRFSLLALYCLCQSVRKSKHDDMFGLQMDGLSTKCLYFGHKHEHVYSGQDV